MKRSWKKKASVWTMAAAMTVSYIPQYSFAEENTEIIKQETQTQTIEEQTILESPTSEALATIPETTIEAPTESVPETSLQVPTESSSESVPETSSQTPSESITPTSSQEESSTQESTPQSSAEASTEEKTSEEESTKETTEETTEETTPEETTTEEPEWSEQAPNEDTKGLTFSFSEDGQTVSITGFDGSRSVVEIPETYGGAKVTSIAAGAFRGQTMITDVVIPEGVTYIGREAFAGCSALVRVKIPTSVTQVGANLFEGTPYDSTLTGELVYINSILYRCQSDAVTVSIRQGTTVIAEEAFINRVNLAAIVVPDGVSYIGSNAFKNCSALSQIEIPKSVRDIVANAFDGTKWYEDRKHEMIYINDLLYRVPAEIIVQSEQPTGSLRDKDAAELAKSGVATQIIPYTDVIVQGETTTICTLAFANTPVQKVQLPSTLTTIRYGAFQNCTALKQITLPKSMTFIEGGAFQNCSALSSILVPQNVTYLGASAFSGCTSLTSATLPQAITRISSGLFENCSSLTTVQASSALTSIGSRAFAETSALSSFTFPQTLTAVGAESFTGSGIVTANLPQSVTYLGAGAFADCTKLVYAQVPAAIQAIRERTFRNCTELKNVSIPEGIRYIGAAAFQNDVSLQTVDFAQSLLTICDNAFEGSGVGEGLVLPPALRTIGSRAFAGCMRLTSLTIPADVRKMGSQAFADGSSPSIVCAFSRTTYMSKLASGWVADWGSGLGALTFTGGAVNDEQKAAFLQMICKLVPDFNASEANNTLYSGIIGRLGVSAKAGGEAASMLGIVSEQAQEGWIRIPELSTRRAILNLTGIWMQDYCPANTGVEDVYYADGWYYINEVSFAETLTKGYLPKGQNGSGYSFFDSYDAPTGMMDGAVTVLLSESDNDYGIAAQVRSSEKITDGRYINVYESVEERELQNQSQISGQQKVLHISLITTAES
ncbi:hypothetical protein DWY36_05015 [Firmicutes bacterium AF25-13AC]|nr:hypothetical protein DWY36_05015 [Firmicutes bacterium AF25-13AC]